MSDTKPLTALQLFQRGVERNHWNKPFDQDPATAPATAPDPESERDAVELKRVIAAERAEARAYQAELDRVSAERQAERRRLMEACTPAWADEAPPESQPRPTDQEIQAAEDAAWKRRMEKTWIGPSSFRGGNDAA